MLQILLSIAFADSEKSCDKTKCPSYPKHYEEMGCEAIKSEGDCCASSFKCPDLTTRDASKCYYKNEVLNATEYLKSSDLDGLCSAACYCQEGFDGGRAEFQCAHIDCPEYFKDSHETGKKCIKQYERNSCCSTETICDDEVNKLLTCEFEGATYHEGQRIYPNNHCYECYCSKNFTNVTAIEDNPSCYKIDCGISLRNTVRIIEGCIPVYYKKDNCCPIGWRCPGEKHMKKPTDNGKSNDGPKCLFGKLEFNIGESLDLVQEECQKCICTTPPMLHCIQSC